MLWSTGASTSASYRGWYRLCVVVWIILGLASCVSFIAALQDIFESVLARVEARAKDRVNSVADTADAAAGTDGQQGDASVRTDVTQLDNLHNRNV